MTNILWVSMVLAGGASYAHHSRTSETVRSLGVRLTKGTFATKGVLMEGIHHGGRCVSGRGVLVEAFSGLDTELAGVDVGVQQLPRPAG